MWDDIVIPRVLCYTGTMFAAIAMISEYRYGSYVLSHSTRLGRGRIVYGGNIVVWILVATGIVYDRSSASFYDWKCVGLELVHVGDSGSSNETIFGII